MWERQQRWKKLSYALRKLFPLVKTSLNYSNELELLISVILSAQCTDKRVNEVTKKLFKKYKNLNDYVRAQKREFESDIYSTGFYRSKTKNILATARIIKERFHGRVPHTLAELIQLPGVGRKTANVVMNNAFNIVEGIAVDTHVKRFAIRFNLTDYIDPKKIEQDLMKIIPKKEWARAPYYMIQYGRTIAPARRYDTSKDPLIKIYTLAGKRFRI
ncbi:endonuclease III [Candidatus Nomurabacteria bacterium RIFCSPLOWO2_01_FULL_36_10b]|uniref:Endonuclease III n=1 Tax=Candidatus Nomurabacteria bacterium RIFCSPLOWO2_01_FULL_36_10b TaxID=1801766 RepID=A0A1F6WPB8_9BACT|nr:MAG: endonuclease III [Candidatus Nomurabacteria bacterium RIFCSPLOWO2_01_FULL_36_10b]